MALSFSGAQRRRTKSTAAVLLAAAAIVHPATGAKGADNAGDSVGRELLPYGKVIINEWFSDAYVKQRLLLLRDGNKRETLCLYAVDGAIAAMWGETSRGHLAFIRDRFFNQLVPIAAQNAAGYRGEEYGPKSELLKMCRALEQRIPAPPSP